MPPLDVFIGGWPFRTLYTTRRLYDDCHHQPPWYYKASAEWNWGFFFLCLLSGDGGGAIRPRGYYYNRKNNNNNKEYNQIFCSLFHRVDLRYSVEVTPLVVLPVVHLPDILVPNPISPSVQAVRPSKSSGRTKAVGYDPPKPRIYFAELSAFFSYIRANLLSSTVSITVTLTNVFTGK